MAQIYSPESWDLFDDLDVSRNPVGPEQLFEVAARHIRARGRMLDVGCRDARHLIRLALEHELTGVGIDPVPWHIERADAAIAEAGLDGRLTTLLGMIEQFDESGDETGRFDLVWCRDVLEVLPDLDSSVAQMARLLAPAGTMIAYTTVLNGPPDDDETRLIHEPLGNVVGNLIETDLEGTFTRHGLMIVEKLAVGTEWREYLEEREQVVSRDLLRLSRLRRDRERITAAYGAQTFALFEASTQWTVHQFLGRFVPVIYVLTRSDHLGE